MVADKNRRPYLKNKAKRAGGVAQVIEKSQALSSNPSIVKKKKSHKEKSSVPKLHMLLCPVISVLKETFPFFMQI
jgi:hypothetical protein